MSQDRWLITGSSGFLGRHAVRAVQEHLGPDRTWGSIQTLSRFPASGDLSTRSQPHVPEKSQLLTEAMGPPILHHAVDLHDHDALCEVIAKVQPDVVLHLAGRTPPCDSELLYRTNTMGTILLLDGLQRVGRPCRVVLAGSAAELGPVPREDLPVGEEYPARPRTAYGISKHLAMVAGQIAEPPVEVIATRLFNPIGPGLPETQAFGRFASVLARPGSGVRRLDVGNLHVRRDFLDVRDAAWALVCLADRGQPGLVYHVGSGQSQRLCDGLDLLIGWSGLHVEVHAQVSPLDTDVPIDSIAEISRLQALGWAPMIPWQTSLHDLWNERRHQARLPLTAA